MTDTDDSTSAEAASSHPTATLEFDGACSGNPGPAAYGFVLERVDEVVTDQAPIGRATNNKAEYRALIAGLQRARTMEVDTLVAHGDSQLIVRQMTGEYDVHSENLRPVYDEATELVAEFAEVKFDWVPRGENTRADDLAQAALADRPSE